MKLSQNEKEIIVNEQIEMQFGRSKTMGWHFIHSILISC
jgi:hypothetical protein